MFYIPLFVAISVTILLCVSLYYISAQTYLFTHIM